MRDAIIVGGGPAGLAAGLYLARAGWRTALFEKGSLGGQARLIESIENYPGFPHGISGRALMGRFVRQARRQGLAVCKMEVKEVLRRGAEYEVLSAEKRFSARAVVFCPGGTFKSLGITGEADLLGRGVYHCAFGEAPRWAGKTVAVVGGGDAAVHQAALLARHAERVYLIHRGRALRAIRPLQRRLASLSAIRPMFRAAVERVIAGRGPENGLDGIEVRNLSSGKPRPLRVCALFVLIGKESGCRLAGRDSGMGRSIGSPAEGGAGADELSPGLFMAGDARPGSLRQVAIAAGDGIRAAMECERHLQGRCAY